MEDRNLRTFILYNLPKRIKQIILANTRSTTGACDYRSISMQPVLPEGMLCEGILSMRAAWTAKGLNSRRAEGRM